MDTIYKSNRLLVTMTFKLTLNYHWIGLRKEINIYIGFLRPFVFVCMFFFPQVHYFCIFQSKPVAAIYNPIINSGKLN